MKTRDLEPVLKVVHLQRKSFPGSYSIERLFENIRGGLSEHGTTAELQIAPAFSKGMWRRFRNILWARKIKAEVLHVTGDIHYVALGTTASRTILTIHDLEMLSRNSGLRRWLLKVFWFDLPLKNVAAVTVISDATRHKLLEYIQIDPSIVEVIPNVVDPKFHAVPYPDKSQKSRILLIGTKPNKNLERTMQALAQVDCSLDIVGQLSEDQRQEFARVGLEYRNHVGITDDMLFQLYQNCHLLCFASTEEGFGLPVVEAQTVGRPVVTSNVSSMPEVAGSAACLVDPFDVQSIRAGVLKVLNDDNYRDSLIQLGFKNRERFDLKTVAGQYAELYRRVAARNSH